MNGILKERAEDLKIKVKVTARKHFSPQQETTLKMLALNENEKKSLLDI